MSGLNDLFYNVGSGTDDVQIRFNNLESFVVSHIQQSTAVIGCMNWLTSKKIINALANLSGGVSIIIDKCSIHESTPEYKTAFHSLKPLKFKIMNLDEQYVFGSHYELESMSPNTVNSDAVRVFGTTHKRYNTRVLMHHKFMIFCSLSDDGVITPTSVITGSYNFTENGGYCRENLIHLTGDQYTSGYFGEWRGCFLLSENIDHYKKDINPQYLKHKNRKKIIKEIAKEYNIIQDHDDPYF